MEGKIGGYLCGDVRCGGAKRYHNSSTILNIV